VTGPAAPAPRDAPGGRAGARYALAAAASAAGLFAAALISTHFDTYTLLPGVIAVALAAWRAGGGPGLAATALCVAGFALAVVPPARGAAGPAAGDALRLLLFAVAGVAISGASRTPRRARDEAEARAAEAARHAEDARASAEALRASEARYRTLVESVRDYAIFRLDPDGRVASWNAGAAAIYGYAADEIVGRHYGTFFPPDARPADPPGRDLPAAGPGRGEDEGWRVRRDGGRFWANVVTTAMRDDAGRVTGYTKVTRDLTERRAAEEARRAGEARLAGIIDSAMDAILTTDADQRVVLANAAAERVFGYPAADLVGRPLETLIPDRYRGAHRAHVRRFGETGTTTRAMGAPGSLAHIGLLARRADGSEFPIEASISQLATPAGRFYTVILRDVTERQRAEDALRASEERARLALDAAQLGTFAWNVPAPGAPDEAAGHRWDARARELYGFAPGEPVTLDRIDARIHPDDRAGARLAFERVAAAPAPAAEAARLEAAYRVVLPDGTERALEVRGRLTFAGEGAARRPERLVGTVLDVTDRVSAAAALRAQYELLDAILAATDDLVFAKDRDGRYVVMNAAGARLQGRRRPRSSGAPTRSSSRRRWPPSCARTTRGCSPPRPRSGSRRAPSSTGSGACTRAARACTGTRRAGSRAWSACPPT
jgi:PAS domain S-box-containing protein